MKTLFYPAIFHPEDIGYSVFIPDVEGCLSQGDTLEEAHRNILDALGLCLEEYEASGDFPKASLPQDLKPEPSDFVMLVEFDSLAYRKRHDTKAIKKTLTIPSWLNEEAERQHINFSSVLQSALKQQLNLD